MTTNIKKTPLPVLKFLFRDQFRALDEALQINSSFSVQNFQSIQDLFKHLSGLNEAVIVIALKDQSDLLQIATLSRLQKKISKQTASKIIVVNFSGDKNLDRALSKLGIHDVLELGINKKALKFKLDFMTKSLQVQSRLNTNSNQGKNKSLLSDAMEIGDRPVWVDPLELEDDIWILKNESENCKKLLGRWIIKLMGPGPHIAQWVEVRRNRWRFEIRDSDEKKFIKNLGYWYYSGEQKPEFVWQDNAWALTAIDNFELYFRMGEKVSYRLKSTDRLLTVCKNSRHALMKANLIVESFNHDIAFKSQAQKLQDLVGDQSSERMTQAPLAGEIGENQKSAKTKDELRQALLEYENSEQKDTHSSTNSNFIDSDLEFEDFKKSKKTSGLDWYPKIENESQANVVDDPNLNSPQKRKFLPVDALTFDYLEKWKKKRAGRGEYQSNEPLPEYWKNRLAPLKTNLGISFKEKLDGLASDEWSEIERDIIDTPDESSTETDEFALEKSFPEIIKVKTLENKEIDELTSEAKVSCFLIQGNLRFEARIDDFFEQQIIFFTEEKNVFGEESVKLDMAFSYLEKETLLKMEAFIESKDDDGEGNYFLTVTLSDVNAIAFNAFMKLFQARQENILEFIKRAKGL